MAIRNEVLFGLKVSFNFSDIESRVSALQNLGLDVRDLDVIRGISTSIDKVDLQNISGLDVNLTRYLDRLKSDSGQYRGIVNSLSGYQFTTKGNFEAYGPISGGAVRFQYIPNDKGIGLNKSDLKYGDISTSRVSSWSSATSDETDFEQPISYGASVQVKGVLKVGQNQNFTPSTGQAIINVLDTPEPIRFATEVPTDMIELEINGQTQYVYAMRGIPIVFTTAFKNISMDFKFTSFGTLNPIFTFQATDGSESEITSVPNVSNNVSLLRYNTQAYKEREIRLYYPPNNITQITGRSINIRFFPKVKFINLEYVDLESNLLGEMPDWQTITYDDVNSTDLNTIRLQNNPLFQSEDETLQRYGSKVIKRLPKSLTTFFMSGTYFGNTEYATADEMVSLIVTQSEYNSVSTSKTAVQNYTIDVQGTAVEVSGIFFDKHFFDGIYYLYVDEVSYDVDVTTILNYQDTIKLFDLSTRCPNLQTFYMRNSAGRWIYPNSNSYYINPDEPFVKISGLENTPRVNIKTIRTYDIYDNSYNRLDEAFINPSKFLPDPANDVSELRDFTVGENESLTASVIDFSKMTNISSIDIYDTALPIPSGLQNRSSLRSVGCGYTRFPSRANNAPIWDTVNGGGNASNINNHFFTNKNPQSFGQYVFSGCNNLRSLSFYASSMDGMIPKFVGNDSLETIDLRYTNIEGGRPDDATANQGLHGRTYIMWDDTFETAQNITDIRIRTSVLGRNIGIYDPATQTYSQASFQGSAFNLPKLSYLEIVSTGGFIRGNFFNVGVAPALSTLISDSTGWGEDLTNGTPLPTFGANPNIRYIQLSNNKFTGAISFQNLNKLEEVYLSSNNITSITKLSNLPALKYFICGNNPNLTGFLPNFTLGTPFVQYISLNNCNFNGYSSGFLSGVTRLRSLDLSNNILNQSSIDTILTDLLSNYNAAPRSGVLINLLGNSAPSRVVINIPTQSTSLAGSENITVNHPDPVPNFGPASSRNIILSNVPTTVLFVGQYLKQSVTGAYGKIQNISGTTITIDSTDTSASTTGGTSGTFNTTNTIHAVATANSATNSSNIVQYNTGNLDLNGNPIFANVLVTSDPGIEQVVISYTPQDPLYQFQTSVDIKTGFVPAGGNTEFKTTIKQDGVDITSLINIDYANNLIVYPGNSPGNVTNYPPDGAVISIEMTQTIYGTRQEIEGGVVTADTLRKKGWIVRTE